MSSECELSEDGTGSLFGDSFGRGDEQALFFILIFGNFFCSIDLTHSHSSKSHRWRFTPTTEDQQRQGHGRSCRRPRRESWMGDFRGKHGTWDGWQLSIWFLMLVSIIGMVFRRKMGFGLYEIQDRYRRYVESSNDAERIAGTMKATWWWSESWGGESTAVAGCTNRG